MATANFKVKPEDGWVAVTDAGVDFIKIRQYPLTQPIFVTTGSTTPGNDVRGYRVDGDEDAFTVNVPEADNFYVRVRNPREDYPIEVFVYYIASA